MRLRNGGAHPTTFETQLKTQLFDRGEHGAQLGRSLLVAAELVGAIVTRGRPAGVTQPHVPLLRVGSLGATGGSCNGVASSPEAFGRAARRCCFSSWRAFRLCSFCFLACL